MKVEAIPTEIAQPIGNVQVFFDTWQTVKQHGRGSRSVSRGFVKPTQQPAAFRCKRHAIKTRFKLTHLLFSFDVLTGMPLWDGRHFPKTAVTSSVSKYSVSSCNLPFAIRQTQQ